MTAALIGMVTERKTAANNRNDSRITTAITGNVRPERNCAASIPAAVSPPTSAVTPVPRTADGITDDRSTRTRFWVAAACGAVVGITTMTAAVPLGLNSGGEIEATPRTRRMA